MTWCAFVESNTTGSGRAFCRAAADRGLRPVVLAQNPDRYPFLDIDRVHAESVDTSDAKAVLSVCRALAGNDGLAGITSSSEYFVVTAARVARALGLPAPDPLALERCRDKARQRRVLAAAGVAVPAFAVVTTAATAVAAARDVGCPVVVKPTDGSGSVGVRLCADPAEAGRWADALLADRVNERGMARSREVLVERYVDGPEFSVETLDTVVVAVVGKHLGPPPSFVETGHDIPADLSHADREALTVAAVHTLEAIGLGWGAAHTELRLTPAGPVVVEVNPRLAGGMLPEAVHGAHGIDMVGRVVAGACGLAPPPDRRGAGAAAVRFIVPNVSGTVRIALTPTAGPNVRAAVLTVACGDPVILTGSFRDRVGYAVAEGTDVSMAASRATAAIAGMRLEIEATELMPVNPTPAEVAW